MEERIDMSTIAATLPPGQRLIDGFPRFGTNLSLPPPAVRADPVLEIRGAVIKAFDIPLTALATLPRRTLNADFHCVAGWSAKDLHWEGVKFETVYRTCIEPALLPKTSITHLAFRGLDRYLSIVTMDDALADGVIVADRLDGRPLDGDHGAPLRLVSPAQYGYMSTKHLCRIEVHASEPRHGHGSPFSQLPARLLFPHSRARVWEEERHRYLPAWALRRLYRATIVPILRTRFRSAEGTSR
jgi:DMSO/TMAO reductase YedYZ molybdopterin-dependent catalytic subunit